MSTATKKSASEIKNAILTGRTAKDGKKRKLTIIAQDLGMKYNTEFVPYCEKNMKEVFKQLGEEMPKPLGSATGERKPMKKAVAPKELVLAVINSKGTMTAKELAKQLDIRVSTFTKQYNELKAKKVALPALPDGELTESDIDELNALIMDATAK